MYATRSKTVEYELIPPTEKRNKYIYKCTYHDKGYLGPFFQGTASK
jgi:hypothetical protein